MKMMKVDRATAEALKARQRGDVIASVRVMLEAGADPTLQTSRQVLNGVEIKFEASIDRLFRRQR